MKSIGLVGLGRMGTILAQRWLNAGFVVVGYDPFTTADVRHDRFSQVKGLDQLVANVEVIWLMIPAGDPVKNTVDQLAELCEPTMVIVDGGNSFFKDSIAYAQKLRENDLYFIDCGVSGGLYGLERGFSLMIGGTKKIFKLHEDVFKAIAAPQGYAYVGPSGAGHYVKMVHNGIEYALLQAYAEGFHLLKEGPFKNLDLEVISKVWQHGAIVDSFILTMISDIFAKDQDFKTISGKVAESGMGRWTVAEAAEQNIPVRLIDDALKIRTETQKTGGNYATKLVAMLRNTFGGHPVEKIGAE